MISGRHKDPQRISQFESYICTVSSSWFLLVTTGDMHLFSHLLGSICNSQHISVNHMVHFQTFWCTQSLKLPKAQTKPSKITRFDAQVISWIPFVTKVMQWMVANRIHGSRHLGVETTYSKATSEGWRLYLVKCDLCWWFWVTSQLNWMGCWIGTYSYQYIYIVYVNRTGLTHIRTMYTI